jgi:anion-transporting  ArsA/GET3 family ATPase
LDPREFCTQTRLVIVAGKGGVGKTTVAAALARMGARQGLNVLIVEIEGKHGLAAAFGTPPLNYDERILHLPDGDSHAAGTIRARTLSPDTALLEYLDNQGLRRISRRLTRTGTVDVVATAAPGIKDIVLLGKVKQLERQAGADLIVLDAPAAGHAVTFLQSPRSLLDTVSGGPIHDQAADVLELLTDRSRSRVLPVTLPEETPVNEVVETAFALEDKVGIDLGPVVVNGVYPPAEGLDVDPEEAAAAAGVELQPGEAEALRRAAGFRLARQQLQQEQLEHLAEALPLPQLHIPMLFTAEIGPHEVDTLAVALESSVTALHPVDHR